MDKDYKFKIPKEAINFRQQNPELVYSDTRELILLLYNIMTTTYYNDTPGMHFEILDYDKFIKDE